MSFNDDMKYRGMFAEDEHYQVSWIPTTVAKDFGTLRVYYTNEIVTATSRPLIEEFKTLRPSPVIGALMQKALWYVNKRKLKDDEKLKDDNSNIAEIIDQDIHDALNNPYVMREPGKMLTDDDPLPWEEAWEHTRTTREWALYWFTGYYSTSGAIVYESKELALHAEKMLKKNIAGVIVVLTPMEGRVPNDGDKE
jgi:hypothetical protein